MRLEIVGQSARDASNPKFGPSRLINLYGEQGGSRRVLRTVLGTVQQSAAFGVNPRALEVIAGTPHVVQGGKLASLSSAYARTDLATVPDSENTTIDGNNGNVTVAAGGSYYVWDGTLLSQPAGLVMDDVTDLVSFGQRTILVEGGGRRLQWSGLLDPTSVSGLDFATTESGEDFNLRAIPLAGALWVFKERSIEQWYVTADGIAYIAGSKIDVGLKARNLIVKLPNAIFWVSSDGKAQLSNRGIVSTVAVENAIATGEMVSCVYYRDKGNEFACIIFEDRPAWCFNLTTQEWHERDQDGAWKVRRVVEAYGAQTAVDVNGNVLTLERVALDGTDPLIRQIVTRTLDFGKDVKVPRVEFVGSTGEHEATLQVEISSDRGRTWSGRRDYTFGAVGDYDYEIIVRPRDQFRAMNFRLTISEPVDVVLCAEAEVDVV